MKVHLIKKQVIEKYILNNAMDWHSCGVFKSL